MLLFWPKTSRHHGGCGASQTPTNWSKTLCQSHIWNHRETWTFSAIFCSSPSRPRGHSWTWDLLVPLSIVIWASGWTDESLTSRPHLNLGLGKKPEVEVPPGAVWDHSSPGDRFHPSLSLDISSSIMPSHGTQDQAGAGGGKLSGLWSSAAARVLRLWSFSWC